MLGPMPRSFAMGGNFFDKFFKKTGNDYVFSRIGGLVHFPLERILVEKHRLQPAEAAALADFLMQILKWFPSDRASARKMLSHPWLKMEDNYQCKMTDLDFQKFFLKCEQGGPESPWWIQGTRFDDVDICKLQREDLDHGDYEDNVSSDSEDSLNSDYESLALDGTKK